MIEISASVYRLVAARLREQIATAEWFNGVVEISAADLSGVAAPDLSADLSGVAAPDLSADLSTAGADCFDCRRQSLSLETDSAPETSPFLPKEGGRGEVAFSAPGAFEGRLTLSAIIYRRAEVRPEGGCCPVSDVVPVWWEFSTVCDGELVINDFCFSEFRPYLIDFD
jgi:hypothetical protein